VYDKHRETIETLNIVPKDYEVNEENVGEVIERSNLDDWVHGRLNKDFERKRMNYSRMLDMDKLR